MTLSFQRYALVASGAHDTRAVFRVQYAHSAAYRLQMEQVHRVRDLGLRETSMLTAPQWQAAISMAIG